MGFSRLYGRDLQHWSPPYQTNSNGNLVSHAVFLKRFILFDDVDDSGDDGGDDGGDDDGDDDDDDKVVRVGSKTGHCGWGRVVLWWMDLLLNKDRRDSFAPF